ncbi:MAG: sulfatase [Paludibacter sp.]|nr:sulfatase [Paludibacter sp.]
MNKTITPIIMGIAVSGAAIAQTTDRPNIIYVFPDQFRNHAMQIWNEEGFKDKVNFKGDPVHTPVLSRFARESVVLTSAQSNCPLSSPHRGMMLTGMYPDGSGVTLNCNSTRPNSSLRADAVTISDVLSRNGYDCAYFGKLHVDFPTPNNPQKPGTYVDDRWPAWDAYTPKERRHGFNYWYSYGTYDVHKEPHYWDNDGNRHEIREWSPKHEADMAIEYLTTVRDPKKPFYMVVSMNPPHSPYNSLDDVMEEDYNLYKDKPLSELLVRPNVNPELTKKQRKTPYYFASVTGVDREFGRILEAVKQLGLEKNTIVVFTSDHGETMTSHVEDPKNSPYAESMNVPFIIRYPGKLKPRVSDLMLSTPDIMPTLLSMAGLKTEIPSAVQGNDLAAHLSGKASKVKAPKGVLYIRNNDGDVNEKDEVLNYFPVSRGIKTDRYTLAITIDRNKKVKEILLFDDKKDPYQMHPLDANRHISLMKRLTGQMKELLKQANDPWYRENILGMGE